MGNKFSMPARVQLENFSNYTEKNNLINVDNFVLTENFGAHGHKFYEVEYVISGIGYNVVNGKSYVLRPGSLFLSTPADFHEVKIVETMEIRKIAFAENAISSGVFAMLANLYDVNLTCAGEDKAIFDASFALIMKENQMKNNQARSYILKNMLECVLLHLITIVVNKSDQPLQADDAGGKGGMQEVLRYMHKNFHDHIDLNSTAAYVHLSPDYLSRLFSKSTGMTFKKYLNDVRLEFAREMLISSRFSVTEICFRSGFGSFSNFLREFKKKYGVSPLKLRKIFFAGAGSSSETPSK
ncbi:MAG: AraC family transcriptional regulator [Clostridiales bacterium]|jgi:AraC-like DNA-binding protein|nr:AraC family transcriptional regulator [Clostridiales bacterium]